MITLPLELWNSMTNINCCLLQGDSGGPLVCERPRGQWTLFGLTSWGSVCFSKVLGPGVYSNVSYFVEWIERQIYIKTFLQKEFQGWAETLPATHTKHGPLDHAECPAKSCTDGLSWAGRSTCPARPLVCTRPVFLSLLFFSQLYHSLISWILFKAQSTVGFVLSLR